MRKIIASIFLCISQTWASPLINLGERLFNEHRFSYSFASESHGNVNFKQIKQKYTSCATCHALDHNLVSMGIRGYNDNLFKSPIEFRFFDQQNHTLRNTPTLIEITSPFYPHHFVHYDAEVTVEQTVLGNLTGRNMGWTSNEKQLALNQMIAVIKNDDGSLPLSQEFGGSYQRIFLGIDPSIPEEFRLDPKDRFDIYKVEDHIIWEKIILAIVSYMQSIEFEKDFQGNFIGSPYDQFLIANGLSTAPVKQQSIIDYTIELRDAIVRLDQPKFIKPIHLPSHKKNIGFGAEEFLGLKIFLNLPNANQSRGMCLNCHMPPLFSDGHFHNIGLIQLRYEEIHGMNSFHKLKIPRLSQRGSRTEYLKIFAQNIDPNNPTKTDLGAWNVFAANGFEKQSDYFRNFFCLDINNCEDQQVADRLIAAMKTPILRNLGHSDPYYHDGSVQSIEGTISTYLQLSKAAQANRLRNPDMRIRNMRLSEQDINPLAKFLNSLNENYE